MLTLVQFEADSLYTTASVSKAASVGAQAVVADSAVTVSAHGIQTLWCIGTATCSHMPLHCLDP
jgi:hypothetical protein